MVAYPQKKRAALDVDLWIREVGESIREKRGLEV
jgi:hypothetical protein